MLIRAPRDGQKVVDLLTRRAAGVCEVNDAGARVQTKHDAGRPPSASERFWGVPG